MEETPRAKARARTAKETTQLVFVAEADIAPQIALTEHLQNSKQIRQRKHLLSASPRVVIPMRRPTTSSTKVMDQ